MFIPAISEQVMTAHMSKLQTTHVIFPLCSCNIRAELQRFDWWDERHWWKALKAVRISQSLKRSNHKLQKLHSRFLMVWVFCGFITAVVKESIYGVSAVFSLCLWSRRNLSLKQSDGTGTGKNGSKHANMRRWVFDLPDEDFSHTSTRDKRVRLLSSFINRSELLHIS